jgi:hypothetical protein
MTPPYTLLRLAVLFFVALLGADARALAQESKEKKPDWFKGDFVVEYSAQQLLAPRNGGGPEVFQAPARLFVDVTDRLHLGVDVTTVISARPLGLERETGNGDMLLLAEFDPVHEGKRTPFVGLFYSAKLPTASAERGLGSGRADHTPLLLLGKTVGPMKTYVEVDMGAIFVGNPTRGGYDGIGLFVLFVAQPIGNELLYKFEIDQTTRSNLGPSSTLSIHKLEIALDNGWKLVPGFFAGLSNNVPHFGAQFGIRYEGNLRDLFGRRKNSSVR